MKKLLRKIKLRISITQQKVIPPWTDSISIDLLDFLKIFLGKKDSEFEEYLIGFFNNAGFKKRDQIAIISTLQKKLTIENLKVAIKREEQYIKRSSEIFQTQNFMDFFIVPETEEDVRLCLSHQNSSEIVVFAEGITKLENYNTIKYLNRAKYYFTMVENRNHKYLRIQFRENDIVLLSIYSPFEKKTEYCKITQIQEIVIFIRQKLFI